MEPERITATWTISLDCECPACREKVDLTDAEDFWSGRKFEAGENMTAATRDVSVYCPKCAHNFTVDFEY
jgi:hypothetical protein